MSQYTVVNENDEVIGYKTKDEITSSDIYRVAALWVTNSKGDILLAQRAMRMRNDPGKWGPAVAGTVERGETYQSNIVKEAEEELGLKNIQPRLGPKVRVSHTNNFWDQWFLMTIDEPLEYFKPDPNEVAAIRWFTQEEFDRETSKEPEKFIKSMPQWKKLFFERHD